jgi:serine/threonine-protein kinase
VIAPTPTGERRRRIDALLDELLDGPVSERRARIGQLCGPDEELCAELERLVRADEHAAGILDRPALSLAAALARDPSPLDDDAADYPPTTTADGVDHSFGVGVTPEARRLGPYRIVRAIGRGGMGRVYLAVRDDAQFERRVAIKVFDQDYSATAIGRFLAERQILASLEHAHIARLLDGGTTPTGRPYFVMEYVPGEPLDRYCDLHALSIEDRLRLMCKVAMAVQHAHRNLVVHRDLKPSNILVTFDGEPRLLDFGIAKLLDPDAEHASPTTRDGERMMTPEYASPEQLDGQPVTTAVDVYALGLILYELLTGHRPQRREGLRFGELEELILSRDPVPPSVAVLTPAPGGVTPERIARARGASPWLLHRKLRGDLDRIVLMALRKEPARRYVSAEQFAADIGRFLDDDPVIARGDATAYRMKKFIVRHWMGVAASVAALLLVVGYALTITVQDKKIRLALDQARLEAERAEQVTSFTMELFDPGARGAGPAALAPSILARSEERARRLDGQPAAQAEMLDVIGRVHQRLGDYAAAEESFDRALALRRRTFGDRHAATAESMQHLATLLASRGRYARADSLYREALGVQVALFGERHPKVARTIDGLGLLEQNRGNYAPAESLFRRALDIRRSLLGPVHPDVAQSLGNLAVQLALQDRRAESEALFRQGLAMRRRLYGEEHTEVATAMSALGLFYFQGGDLAGADSLYRGALAMRRRFLGEQHPDVAQSLGLLAALLRKRGQLAAAESLYTSAIAMARQSLGDDHPDVAHARNGLALVLRDEGRLAQAESLYRVVLETRRRTLGPEHPAIATSLDQLGTLVMERGDSDCAEGYLLAALAMRRHLLGDAHPQTIESAAHVVALYEGRGEFTRADMYRPLARSRR